MTASLQKYLLLTGELIYQLKANRMQDESSKLGVIWDTLKARVLALSAIHLPKTEDIDVLEAARLEFQFMWAAVQDGIGKLSRACTKFCAA